MTPAQLAIIREQNAVLKQSQIDIATLKSQTQRQIENLENAAERQRQEINARAFARVQELGLEYKRLTESVNAEKEVSP